MALNLSAWWQILSFFVGWGVDWTVMHFISLISGEHPRVDPEPEDHMGDDEDGVYTSPHGLYSIRNTGWVIIQIHPVYPHRPYRRPTTSLVCGSRWTGRTRTCWSTCPSGTGSPIRCVSKFTFCDGGVDCIRMDILNWVHIGFFVSCDNVDNKSIIDLDECILISRWASPWRSGTGRPYGDDEPEEPEPAAAPAPPAPSPPFGVFQNSHFRVGWVDIEEDEILKLVQIGLFFFVCWYRHQPTSNGFGCVFIICARPMSRVCI